MNLFQVQSTIILLLLWFGIFKRKNRKIHVPVMAVSIAWDLILILQIEFARKAINTAMKASVNPFIMNFHIFIAVTTVVLYFVNIYYGRKLLKGDQSVRSKHKACGMATMLLRTMVYVTSYMVAS